MICTLYGNISYNRESFDRGFASMCPKKIGKFMNDMEWLLSERTNAYLKPFFTAKNYEEPFPHEVILDHYH